MKINGQTIAAMQNWLNAKDREMRSKNFSREQKRIATLQYMGALAMLDRLKAKVTYHNYQHNIKNLNSLPSEIDLSDMKGMKQVGCMFLMHHAKVFSIMQGSKMKIIEEGVKVA